MNLRYTLWLMTLVAFACSAGQLRAENEGQPDLDKAVDLKLDAESMEDLEKVAELCESALEKGLEEEDQRFAKQLLTSVRYQRAETYARNVLESAQQRRDWQMLRSQAIEELDIPSGCSTFSREGSYCCRRGIGIKRLKALKKRLNYSKGATSNFPRR